MIERVEHLMKKVIILYTAIVVSFRGLINSLMIEHKILGDPFF